MLLALLLISILSGCKNEENAQYDIVIYNCSIYDGSGGNPYSGCIAITGDQITYIGDVCDLRGKTEIDAQGHAAAPGFINMLSRASKSLLADPRAVSDISQGVTLEVLGGGWSMGPLNKPLKEEMLAMQGDVKFAITWSTLGEYLRHLETTGTGPNVASFVGASQVRSYVMGIEDRIPEVGEMEQMRRLVREAMEEGAMGVSTSLSSAPGFYASKEEIIELAKVAAEYGGMYTTELRSEANRLLESLDEAIEVGREAAVPIEICHLEAAGEKNWPKMEAALTKIDSARDAGLKVTADMHPYTSLVAGLDATMPPWVQEGGYEALAERLTDPLVRTKVISEMQDDSEEWDNLYAAAGGPEKIVLAGFRNDSLKMYTGMTLAEVAGRRNQSAEETVLDLVIEDGSPVVAMYFVILEENVRKLLTLPYMSFCSDATAPTADGVFLQSNPHPAAYGSFARVLGYYVHEENVLPLAEAIRRLTSLPAENLRLEKRGLLREGYFADIVLFDPENIRDHATYGVPHQYSTGVSHVLVNGQLVFKEGKPTGATPGRFIHGPGFEAE